MGMLSVFRAGKAAQAGVAPAPKTSLSATPPQTRFSHAGELAETEAPAPFAVELRGPKGRFSLTVQGQGNEPEFNAFLYTEAGVRFYYYASEAVQGGKRAIIVHMRSRERFSGLMGPFPRREEERVRANIEWALKNRVFSAPQMKEKRATAPKLVIFNW